MKQAKSRKKSSLLFRSLLAVFLVVTSVVIFVAIEIDRLQHESYVSDVREETTLELIEAREEIEESIFAHFLLLQKLTTIIEENPNVTQEDFASYVASLDYEGRDIVNFATARDLVVDMVHPMEGNEDALGLDYARNADQYPGVQRAIENGRATIVGPVDLVQGGRAFIFRQPAYVSDPSTAGNERLWGVVSIVADYDEFVSATGLAALTEDFDVLIRSASDAADNGNTILGQPDVEAANPIRLSFEFPTGSWDLLAVPAGGWPAHSPTYVRDRLLLAGVSALVIGVVLLITALAVLQRRAQMRLATAIDAMDDGFAMYDQNGRLVAFNAKYAELYRVPEGQIQHGARFEDIIRLGVEGGQHPDAIGREEEWIEMRIKRFYGQDAEFEQELANGRHLLASDHALSDGGRVCVRTDVTELKQALHHAEAASRAKSEFIDTLSHELRTPITVIMGLASLGKNIETLGLTKSLREELDKPEIDVSEVKKAFEVLVKHFTGTMEKQEKSAKHLHGLVEDMIDFAKTETQTLSVRPEVLNIDDLASSVIDQSRMKAEEEGLELKISSAGGQVFCDQLRTTQILLNLVGNAIKFTEEGSVELTAYQDGETAIFEVLDTGPGISSEDQGRIFEAFRQLESSSTRKQSGLGLGLAISRSLAKVQNGSLDLESEPGKGSKFTLRLPSGQGLSSKDDSGFLRQSREAAA